MTLLIAIGILVIASLTACGAAQTAAIPIPMVLAEITASPTATSPISTLAPTDFSEIARENLTIDLGDFQTQAELTYPADGGSVYPTVILLHGSAPADMDYARFSTWGDQPLLSRNFLDIANYLTLRGFAVLRFNKHYVSGPQEVDWDKFSQNMTLQMLLGDAETVLAAAKANAHVDRARIFVLGFSEGSVIGAALSANHPELAGLILQSPLTLSFRDSRRDQVLDVGIPYLRTVAPDGNVTDEVLKKAIEGAGGEIAKRIVWYLLDPTALENGSVTILADMDSNADGAISIDKEFLPSLDVWLDNEFSGVNSMYAEENALPSATEQAAYIKVPVLIQQGENDSAAAGKNLYRLEQALVSAGHTDFQLIVYPGLGATLGLADSVIDDNLRPIEQRPLEDLVRWLRDHHG